MELRELTLMGAGVLGLILSYAAYIVIGARYPLTLLQRAGVFFLMELIGTAIFGVLLSIVARTDAMFIVLMTVMPPLLLLIALTNWNSERQWVKRIRDLADRAEMAQTQGNMLDAAQYYVALSKQLKIMGRVPDLADIRARIQSMKRDAA
jgi:hypothetical protein